MTDKNTDKATKVTRKNIPQTLFPIYSLEYSKKIAQALIDNFAGKSGAPLDIAIALDMSPTSGGWRGLCGSSVAYGLTKGGYGVAEITLTDLGRRIVAPEEEGEDKVAMLEAISKPKFMHEFYEKYDKSKFPKDDIAVNVLVRMGLPRPRAEQALEILKKNGEFTGVIRNTKTGSVVSLNLPTDKRVQTDPSLEDSILEESVDSTDSSEPSTQISSESTQTVSEIFVAHGKNKPPVQALKQILDRFKVPYQIAMEQPHEGRPISQKVADLMKTCSAGIFIFTKDEKFLDEKGDVVWRPSENVVFELGAGSVLWGKKIIILREAGVNFPSDFSDLGYIQFENGELGNRGLEILAELVALEFVTFQAIG